MINDVTVSIITTIFILLQLKHLVVDWLWQPEYEYLNKGTYGHFGGIRHAGKNALGTAIILCCGYWQWFLIIFLLDFVIHYHIDWAKVNINKKMGWGPTTHNEFWHLTGFDQYLHQMTYIFLTILVVCNI